MEDKIKGHSEGICVKEEDLPALRNEMLNEVKNVYHLASNAFKEMIIENYQCKDKVFAQRANDKEDPRKEDQGSTINTSAMLHNQNSYCWSRQLPPGHESPWSWI